jgi:hypothetical protein
MPTNLPLATITALPDEVTIEQMQINSNGKSVSSLHIFGGGYDYKIEPLANGLFLLGPNKKFLVYFTNNAEVYAGRIGSPYLVEIAKLAYEFPATREGNALFELSLQKNGVIYTLVIYEKRYNSRNSVVIPTTLTE